MRLAPTPPPLPPTLAPPNAGSGLQESGGDGRGLGVPFSTHVPLRPRRGHVLHVRARGDAAGPARIALRSGYRKPPERRLGLARSSIPGPQPQARSRGGAQEKGVEVEFGLLERSKPQQAPREALLLMLCGPGGRGFAGRYP